MKTLTESMYDYKAAYRAAADRKRTYLELVNNTLKHIKVSAVVARVSGNNKFLDAYRKFKLRLASTAPRDLKSTQSDANESTRIVMRITKWIEYDKWVNNGQRQIIDYYSALPNELVFENDYRGETPEDAWNNPIWGQRTVANKICDVLNEQHIPYRRYFSGGKGPHIHVLHEIPDDPELIRRIEQKGLMPQDLRLFLFNMICDWAEIPAKARGKGGIIDTANIDWSDHSKGHLIRCCGGRKFKGAELNGYKTIIDNVPERLPELKNFTKVRYPNKIELWHIDNALLNLFVNSVNKKTAKIGTSSLGATEKNFSGKHLNLPCTLSMRLTSVKMGKRHYAAQMLAIACRLDGLQFDSDNDCKADANVVMNGFYAQQIHDDFPADEVYNCFLWIYKKEDTFWNCAVPRKIGFCDPDNCPLEQERNARYSQSHHSPHRPRRGKQPRQLRNYARKPTGDWVRIRNSRRRSKP